MCTKLPRTIKSPQLSEAPLEAYIPYIARIIRNQLGQNATREDVEELCSDVLLAHWKSDPKPDPDGLGPWLAAVARNKARSFLRKKRLPTVPMEEEYLVTEEGELSLLNARERAILLEQALDRLPPEDREIMERYYYYGQTVAQVACAMCMVEATVKTRLFRGREALRKILEQDGYVHED